MLDDVYEEEAVTLWPLSKPKRNLYRKFIHYTHQSLLQWVLTRRLLKYINADPNSLVSTKKPTDKTPLLDARRSQPSYDLERDSDEAIQLEDKIQPSIQTESAMTRYESFHESSGGSFAYHPSEFKQLERRLGFLKGARIFTQKLWPTVFTVLILTDLIEYAAYPSERYGNRVWEIFAGLARDAQILSSYLGMELPPRVAYSVPVAALVSLPMVSGLSQLLSTCRTGDTV